MHLEENIWHQNKPYVAENDVEDAFVVVATIIEQKLGLKVQIINCKKRHKCIIIFIILFPVSGKQ